MKATIQISKEEIEKAVIAYLNTRNVKGVGMVKFKIEREYDQMDQPTEPKLAGAECEVTIGE
jgi:hypothetical protein